MNKKLERHRNVIGERRKNIERAALWLVKANACCKSDQERLTTLDVFLQVVKEQTK